MRKIAALLAVCVASCAILSAVLSACERSAPAGKPSGGSAPTRAPAGSPAPGLVRVPPPDEPVPVDPRELAAALAEVSAALRSSIEAWTASGGTSGWPPPRPLVLQALYEQRIYRTLALDPKLAQAVIPLLPPAVRDEATANAAAGEALFSKIRPPDHRIRLRTRPPLPADGLLGYYEEAERRFGVAWEVLAAVNFVESKFGRVRSASSAGARGPMQFLPSTWKAYGLGGDVNDPHGAILGAANYLAASGAPANYREALHHYNPVNAYVKAVMLYARRMMRVPRTFYAYYNWQVFVVTPNGGFERLTGPSA